MNVDYVQMEVIAGSNIWDVVEEAIKFCLETDYDVKFTFNGTKHILKKKNILELVYKSIMVED